LGMRVFLRVLGWYARAGPAQGATSQQVEIAAACALA
jgi:hypothetical protein